MFQNNKGMSKHVIMPPSTNQEEFILDYVHKHGYPTHRSLGDRLCILARMFSEEHIENVLRTGTDRDSSSGTYLSVQGERVAQQGLFPEDIIYTECLANVGDLREGFAISTYDSEKMRFVSQDMCTPIQPNTFYDALIAVFSRK